MSLCVCGHLLQVVDCSGDALDSVHRELWISLLSVFTTTSLYRFICHCTAGSSDWTHTHKTVMFKNKLV